MSLQPLSNQKAEIAFREKLYLQQVQGKALFDDEFDSVRMENILEERMKKTLTQMALLRDRDVLLSPYIEIGAERCQRSLVMENDVGASGCAVDISYHLLKSCHHYQQAFKKPKAPIRVCCDANNLPFRTGAIPFVFCYETLHHFPEPAPVVREIYRVLSPGGFFFFDEEPYKKILHINLWSGNKIYSRDHLTRSFVRKVLDRLFAAPACNEVEHGVIENDEISIAQWKLALAPFTKKDVQLTPSDNLSMQADLFNPGNYLKRLLVILLGGKVSGICQKTLQEGAAAAAATPVLETLICPSCKASSVEAPITRTDSGFVCMRCLRPYPVVDDVLFLFTPDKLSELYPDVLSVAGQRQAG